MRDDDRLGFGEYWLYLDMKEDFSGRKPCDEDSAISELIQKGLERMYWLCFLIAKVPTQEIIPHIVWPQCRT